MDSNVGGDSVSIVVLGNKGSGALCSVPSGPLLESSDQLQGMGNGQKVWPMPRRGQVQPWSLLQMSP